MATSKTGMDGTALSGVSLPPPPQGSWLNIPSQKWDATNMMFVHDINGQEIPEIPKAPPVQDGNHYEVPADSVKDWVDMMYGPMPEAMTARPIQQEFGCCPPKKYQIARHMFGDAVAIADVDLPACICMYLGGCTTAKVTVTPKDGQAGVTYEGELSRKFCGECLGNETTLAWNTATKPRMTFKAMSTLDSCKLNFCQDVWLGWRGTSESVGDKWALYDASLILNICMGCKLMCNCCKGCCVGFCSRSDTAPRFARAEDLRRVVLAKYDYEFACRNVETTEGVEVSQGENAEELTLTRVLPAAHTVDALFSTRLYHDVVCGKPQLKFGRDDDAKHEREAAVDVRYRGSVRHNVVSEDDHLIVLAALIMQAVWFFPAKGNQWAANGPAFHNVGRLVPRDSSIATSHAV